MEGTRVHVVVRSYAGEGASELFDLLAQREDEVKNLISGVAGLSAMPPSATLTAVAR
jgi:hypothetical protein